MADAYLSNFEPHTVGSSKHVEYWIPAEALSSLNWLFWPHHDFFELGVDQQQREVILGRLRQCWDINHIEPPFPQTVSDWPRLLFDAFANVETLRVIDWQPWGVVQGVYAKLFRLCKQELSDCQASERPRSSASLPKPTSIQLKVARKPVSA